MDLLGLWTLTGFTWLLAFMAMFSIGIFIVPVAIGLSVAAILLTVRRPGSWPSIAGLGLAFAAGVAWLGWTLASWDPEAGSCWESSEGVTTCEPAAQTNWDFTSTAIGIAIVIAFVTLVGWYFLSMRSSSARVVSPRSP